LHSIALHAGVRALEARGVRAVAPLTFVLQRMLELGDGAAYAAAYAHVEDVAERAAMVSDLPRDFHAGFFETSLSLHFAPDSVHPGHRALPACAPVTPAPGMLAAARVAAAAGATDLARELRFAAHGLGWYALRPFPGYTGSPHRATAAAGAFFAERLLDELVPRVLAVLEGGARSPRPVMGWLPAVSFGGRLGRAHVPFADLAPPPAEWSRTAGEDPVPEPT
jgi:creatinine amidohydrolase